MAGATPTTKNKFWDTTKAKMFWSSAPGLVAIVLSVIGMGAIVTTWVIAGTIAWAAIVWRHELNNVAAWKAIGVLALLSATAVTAFVWYENSKPWPMSNEMLSQREISDKSFYISDFTRGSQIIENRVFVRCEIYGPAVVISLPQINQSQNYFADSIFAIPPGLPHALNYLMFVVPEGTVVNGMIRLQHCEFRQCRFHFIQFAVTPHDRDSLAKQLTPALIASGFTP